MTIYDYQDCRSAERAAEIEYQTIQRGPFAKGVSIFFDENEKVWIVRRDDYDKAFRCPAHQPYGDKEPTP